LKTDDNTGHAFAINENNQDNERYLMANLGGRKDTEGRHSAASLRNQVTIIRNLLAPAIRLAGEPDDPQSKGAMQAAGLDEIKIKYEASLERAKEELGRWVGQCEIAWNKQLSGGRGSDNPNREKKSARGAKAKAR
jgi:hypothetical protein